MQRLTRYLRKLFFMLAFGLLLGLSIKNASDVTIHGFFESEWHLPMAVLMLLMFAAGVLFGISALLFKVFRLQRELAKLRKLAPRVSPSTRLLSRSGDTSDSF